MTEEKLVELAKQAGFSGVRTVWSSVKDSHSTLCNVDYKQLAKFAQIVSDIARDKERQRCISIARNYPFSPNIGTGIAESILKED